MRTPGTLAQPVETAGRGSEEVHETGVSATSSALAERLIATSAYTQKGLERLHAGHARRNQEREAELRARFQATNGPGPE